MHYVYKKISAEIFIKVAIVIKILTEVTKL